MTECTYKRKACTAADTWTFYFEPSKPFRYVAGQFVDLYLPQTAAMPREKRWFTLSSSPTEELLSITTKVHDAPTAYKQRLVNLKPGERVVVSDAMGDFVLPIDKNRPLILAAAGIGITPVRSMLQWLHDTQARRDVTVLYAVTHEDQLAFQDLLMSSTAKLHYFVTSPRSAHMPASRMTANDIAANAHAANNPVVYVSGPEEWVEKMVTELHSLAVKPSQLVTDYFTGYTKEAETTL